MNFFTCHRSLHSKSFFKAIEWDIYHHQIHIKTSQDMVFISVFHKNLIRIIIAGSFRRKYVKTNGIFTSRPCLIIQQQENTGAKEQGRFQRFYWIFRVRDLNWMRSKRKKGLHSLVSFIKTDNHVLFLSEKILYSYNNFIRSTWMKAKAVIELLTFVIWNKNRSLLFLKKLICLY